MKSFLKERIADLVMALPWGARKAITERLVDEVDRYEFFLKMAQSYNVEGLLVGGRYGLFESRINDRVMLKLYGRDGVWAERTNTIIRDFFLRRGGGTYLDIGANIGLTTVPIACDPAVTCIAIEPEPNNYGSLIANVARNCRSGNVRTVQVAVYSKAGKMDFELSPTNLGDHRLKPNDSSVNEIGEANFQLISVEALPLDAIVPDIQGTLAVKMDIQGAEPFAIEGGRRTLGGADLIIMEFWPYSMRRMNADPEVTLRFLRENFTHLALAENETGTPSAPMPVDEALRLLRGFVQAKLGNAESMMEIIAQREARPDAMKTKGRGQAAGRFDGSQRVSSAMNVASR